MTDNFKEIFSQPLRPLPELPVLRDSYCSKETVDRTCRWLHDNHPEWLMKVLEEEWGNRRGHYLDIRNLLAHLKRDGAEQIDGLTPYLGEIDLLYEIDRRLRSAYGLPEIPLCGKPLAPSPNGPFPPLPVLKISPLSEQWGATQEIVDTVLADFYDQRPDIWFTVAEVAQRRLGHLIGGSDRSRVLRKIILKRGFAKDVRHQKVQKGDLTSIEHACNGEFFNRLRAMCDLPPNNLIDWKGSAIET